jgi:hypothetical protein
LLGYVSRQIGHSKPTVTAEPYAKWLGGDDYRDPLAPRNGELPADLLARIPAESPSDSRHRSRLRTGGEIHSPQLAHYPHANAPATNVLLEQIPEIHFKFR